jgi:predicted ATPase
MSLNPNQKRALEVQMQCLERTLLEVQQKLRETPDDGHLVRYRGMATGARVHVEAAIDRMLAELAVIAREFGLHSSVEDLGS